MGKGPEKPKDPAPAAPPVRAGDPSTTGGDNSPSKLTKRKERARKGFQSTILANRPGALKVTSPEAASRQSAPGATPNTTNKLGGLLRDHFNVVG